MGSQPRVEDIVAAASPLAIRVNVVDDDPAVLSSLRFLLETEGFDVRTFRSGPALLNSDAVRKADGFVIDYKMETMNGLDLATRLRTTVQAPVILITGFPDDGIAAKASAAGIHAVLMKPHLEDSLAATLRSAIRQTAPDTEG
ncbi:response regulator [Bradyrhizobium sp. 2TAF24]|uniref:response regulator n=1 Tax=Bradyrhizobium sp. 2TAF24 TaxID=3233011 RepID=UPI003F926B9B